MSALTPDSVVRDSHTCYLYRDTPEGFVAYKATYYREESGAQRLARLAQIEADQKAALYNPKSGRPVDEVDRRIAACITVDSSFKKDRLPTHVAYYRGGDKGISLDGKNLQMTAAGVDELGYVIFGGRDFITGVDLTRFGDKLGSLERVFDNIHHCDKLRRLILGCTTLTDEQIAIIGNALIRFHERGDEIDLTLRTWEQHHRLGAYLSAKKNRLGCELATQCFTKAISLSKSEMEKAASLKIRATTLAVLREYENAISDLKALLKITRHDTTARNEITTRIARLELKAQERLA